MRFAYAFAAAAALAIPGPATAATFTFHAETDLAEPGNIMSGYAVFSDSLCCAVSFADMTDFQISFVGGSTFTLADLATLPEFQFVDYHIGDGFFTFIGNASPLPGVLNVLTATNSDLSDGFFLGVELGVGGHWADYRAGLSGTFNNIGTDLVFSAVPEPGTWALLIIGFGGLGATLRRIRRTAATASANREARPVPAPQ